MKQTRKVPLDLSLMPYLLFPTGNRDKSIGDIYLYNPTDESDATYGINLLLGRRHRNFYFTANIGYSHMESDLDYIENDTAFFGLAAEYQISERWTTYLEFLNNEHKSRFQYPEISPCYDEDAGDDIREIGLGVVKLYKKWGFKIHLGAGLTPTSPDFRVIGLVNYNLASVLGKKRDDRF